jgi:ADP-heptose:LPS heptosyltransferase
LPNDKYVGISMTQGNLYRKKTLPLDYIIEVAKHLISINKKPVFLIEKKHSSMVEWGFLVPFRNRSSAEP